MGEIDGVRWWLGPGVEPARAQPLLARALAALADAEALESPGPKGLYRLALAGAKPDFLLKVRRYGRRGAWPGRLRTGRARRELALASALARREVAVAVPLAAGERRRAGLLRACYLLVPIVDGAEDLARLWRAGEVASRERRAWATALGRLARRLHELGLDQADFAPNNFLVLRGEPPRLLPVDFERARLRGRLGARARGRMLADLDGRLEGCGAATRLRLLVAYSGGERAAARRQWRRAELEAARLAARELDHLRRAGTRESRRFQPFASGGWRGWARRDTALLGLVARDLAADTERRPSASAAPRIEACGALWRWSASGVGPREARRVWAAAQLLWQRGGLTPLPLALARRFGEAQLWLARDPAVRRLDELAGVAPARWAAVVLIDRLLALGRLAPRLDAGSVALAAAPGGRWRAVLLDPSAWRPGRPVRRERRARARRLVGDLLARRSPAG